VAQKVKDLGYTVIATEAQQYKMDEAIFSTIKKRGFLAISFAAQHVIYQAKMVF
jgi:hypothetical protein